jgi:hypothetical protein
MFKVPMFISDIYVWAKADYKAYPTRFILEVLSWMTSIACSVTMALTIPFPPFMILYPLFIMQCSIFGWAAWTRRSFGMVGNYALLVSIDSIALARLFLG